MNHKNCELARKNFQSKIWQIIQKIGGAVDGWDFKQYFFTILFYRILSEEFADYMDKNYPLIDNYKDSQNNDITPEVRENAIIDKGFFIYPDQLFINVAKNIDSDYLTIRLSAIFSDIENTTIGRKSEKNFKNLFIDFHGANVHLGESEQGKRISIAKIIKGICEINVDSLNEYNIDLFGDAYEFLIAKYAGNARRFGGEFFTPQNVSKLIARLAMHNQTSVNKIYDPACGSGSLLLQAKKYFDQHIVEEGFFGQEINHTTYNLARMNMFLHNINYDKFNIQLGDTLIHPYFLDEKPFDVIVSNPPYSLKWIGSDDPTLINDDRFAPAGVLAPKSKADFAFVLHSLSFLSSKGRAVMVCFAGIFYRSGAEQKIRKYLVDNNYVETIISLPSNLFYGTDISVTILILAKNKTDTKIQFINASGQEFFKKETNNNVMLDEHIQNIIDIFDSKKNIANIAESIPYEKIVENDYNLSINSYVQAKDNREIIDITKLNAEVKTIVGKIEQLRKDIDGIITEIES